MAKQRYSRDYRLSETFDEKGHVHVDYEYIGDDWFFVSNPDVILREKKLAILFCVIGWTVWIGSLIPPTAGMHRLYIALPYVFLAVPLAMYVRFTSAFYQMKEPLEHRHADRLNNKHPLTGFLMTVFGMISAILEAILLLRGQGSGSADIILEACALVLLYLGASIYRRKDKIRAEVRKGK